MVTITLPPDLEASITECARRQGTTPELWSLDTLSHSIQIDNVDEKAIEPNSLGETMLDFFSGYVGVLNSSEFVPGGAQMSANMGVKFADGMVKKRQEGKL